MAKFKRNLHKILLRPNIQFARQLYSGIPQYQLAILRDLTLSLGLSVSRNELLWIGGRWYVSHPGLLRIAHRRKCLRIHTSIESTVSEPSLRRWVFKATVYLSATNSFVGYGDADPSNVSPLVHGAEMRVAETRAVNRALRAALGIGLCSVEEIGSVAEPGQHQGQAGKLPPQPANGNQGSPKVRDRLCQIIRQHQLDPNLVKAYATDFCGTKTLREAAREQVENFVVHLADWAEKDRDALLCQLNSYLRPQEGAA
jgi:hypothetical protein